MIALDTAVAHAFAAIIDILLFFYELKVPEMQFIWSTQSVFIKI